MILTKNYSISKCKRKVINSQLDKMKSATKNNTGVTRKLSSNMIGDASNEAKCSI